MDIESLKREWEDVLGFVKPTDIICESEDGEDGAKSKDLIPMFTIDGPDNIEDAYKAYEHFYLKPVKAFLKNAGQFYSFYVTSRKRPEWFLKAQCRVKDIGVMEGRDKKFVVGVIVQLFDRYAKSDVEKLEEPQKSKVIESKDLYKKSLAFLHRIPSALAGDLDVKKFNHIKTETVDFSDDVKSMGDNYFAIPIHWVPQLQTIIEKDLKAKRIKDSAGNPVEFPWRQYLKDLADGKIGDNTPSTGGYARKGNIGNLNLDKLKLKKKD